MSAAHETIENAVDGDGRRAQKMSAAHELRTGRQDVCLAQMVGHPGEDEERLLRPTKKSALAMTINQHRNGWSTDIGGANAGF
jgi:hypothetical protein